MNPDDNESSRRNNRSANTNPIIQTRAHCVKLNFTLAYTPIMFLAESLFIKALKPHENFFHSGLFAILRISMFQLSFFRESLLKVKHSSVKYAREVSGEHTFYRNL